MLERIGKNVMRKGKSKIKEKIYEIVGLLLAVALFAAGVYGVVFSRIASREYKNSDDIRKVTAIVEYAKDTSNDDDDYNKYWAKLSFVVDGKTYKGAQTFYCKLHAGDEVTVEVYRTSNGRYKLTPEGNPIHFLFYCIAIPVGGFITVAMASVVFTKDTGKQAAERSKRRSNE